MQAIKDATGCAELVCNIVKLKLVRCQSFSQPRKGKEQAEGRHSKANRRGGGLVVAVEFESGAGSGVLVVYNESATFPQMSANGKCETHLSWFGMPCRLGVEAFACQVSVMPMRLFRSSSHRRTRRRICSSSQRRTKKPSTGPFYSPCHLRLVHEVPG